MPQKRNVVISIDIFNRLGICSDVVVVFLKKILNSCYVKVYDKEYQVYEPYRKCYDEILQVHLFGKPMYVTNISWIKEFSSGFSLHELASEHFSGTRPESRLGILYRPFCSACGFEYIKHVNQNI